MIALGHPSHAFGIGYSLWLRGRSAFLAAWLIVLALALAAHVPAFQVPLALGAISVPPIVFAVPVVILPVISLLNAFTYGPIDLSSKASLFPMHARLLPLSTRALVGWPMLFGMLTIGSLWLVLLGLVLRPLGLTTSVVWPTTIIVTCTVWAQAIAWIPLPLRFVRVPLFLAFVGLPLCFATLDPRQGDFFWSFEGAMLAWAALAYVLATIGLTRARNGITDRGLRLPERAPVRRPEATADAPPLPPFPSATAARRWFELRRTTSFFAKAFALASIPVIALSLLALAFPRGSLAYRLGPGALPLASTWSAIFLVVGPFLASVAMGGYVGRLGLGEHTGLASFFALRPVSTARLVADKLVSAAHAAGILFASAATVAASAAWAHTANAPPAVRASLARWIANGGLVDVALVAIGFAFLLWRNLAVDLWATMTGRRWASRAVAASAALGIAAVPAALAWLKSRPELGHQVGALLPWLVRVVLAAKLASAALVGRTLLRRSLVSGRLLLVAGGAWCVAAVLLVGLVSRFVHLSGSVVCLVLALVPLTRLGLAPIALDRSRHP